MKVEQKSKKKKPQVEENRDAKPIRRKKVGAKREKGDVLVIKTEHRCDAKLVDLGADVCSIRRARTGEMILELKRDNECKGATNKSLGEEVLDEEVEVRALTSATTLKVKNLNEVTEAEKLVTALR